MVFNCRLIKNVYKKKSIFIKPKALQINITWDFACRKLFSVNRNSLIEERKNGRIEGNISFVSLLQSKKTVHLQNYPTLILLTSIEHILLVNLVCSNLVCVLHTGLSNRIFNHFSIRNQSWFIQAQGAWKN